MINRRSLLACAVGAVSLLGAATLAACGDDSGGDSSGSNEFKVENVWARQSPMATTLGAVYMDITAEKTDTLVKAAVDASVAATVEIHETVMGAGETETSMADTTMPGTTMAGDTMTTMAGDTMTTMAGDAMEMSMRPVDKIDLPAGTTVKLEPGGYHVMLIDLAKPLEVGQSFDVTLTMGSGATIVAKVEVREDAP